MLADSLDDVLRAKSHAEGLYELSLQMDNILTDTRNTSAVRAVSAYRDMLDNIGKAKLAADESREAVKNATDLVKYLNFNCV